LELGLQTTAAAAAAAAYPKQVRTITPPLSLSLSLVSAQIQQLELR